MDIQIIGIDCATNDKKVGIARGLLSANNLEIDLITKPTAKSSIGNTISPWLGRTTTTLLAMDAPLGWPIDLGSSLTQHQAGNYIPINSNQLFRRETDRFIKSRVGKQPLDVGADRIARTALAALNNLDDISSVSGHTIPLAWSRTLENGVFAIEVYPAATLKQSGILSSGYKDKSNNHERKEILGAVSAEINFKFATHGLCKDDDLLDAAICVLAGYHFIQGLCYQPENMDTAIKEGWIWVKTDN